MKLNPMFILFFVKMTDLSSVTNHHVNLIKPNVTFSDRVPFIYSIMS